MKKAVEELWESGLNERYPEWSEEEYLSIDIKDSDEEKLRESLSDEQKSMFDKLMEDMVRVGAVYEKSAFCRGYSLATRVLIESLFEK